VQVVVHGIFTVMYGSKVCVENPSGLACSATQPCPIDMFVDIACVNNVCTELRSAGDPCTENGECAGTSMCSNGVCVGLPVNATCPELVANPCAYPAICVGYPTRTCIEYPTVGQSCEEFQGCQSPYTCDNNVCHLPFSKSAGEGCYGSDDCQDGMVCYNQVCTKVESQYTACRNDSDCPMYESCGCFPEYGKSLCTADSMTMCSSSILNLQLCANAHQCYAAGGLAWYPVATYETCTNLYCQSEIDAVQKCECDVQDPFVNMTPGSCYHKDDLLQCSPKHLKPYQIALISVGCVVFVVVIVLVIVKVVVRRRHHHHHYHEINSGHHHH